MCRLPEDNAYQLTKATRTGGSPYTESWWYDADGNRTKRNIYGADTLYTYDSFGKMTQAGTTQYKWDRWGNVTQIGASDFYYWDDDDRLARYDSTTDDSKDTSYSYFPGSWQRAKRVKGTSTPVTRLFSWDGPNLEGEYGGDGSLAQAFATVGIDGELATRTGGATYYYMRDGLGSVRNVTDSSEGTQNTYDYRSYGEDLGTYSATVANPFKYTGAYSENWHGMQYYMRNRNYMPGVGVFSSRDAMWADPVRGYSYAARIPTLFFDPYGLEIVVDDEPGGFAQAVAGAFQAVIGNSGTVTMTRNGDGRSIGLADNNGGNPATERAAQRLRRAINSPYPINIHYKECQFITFPGEQVSPFGKDSPMDSAEVYVDPWGTVSRPIVDPSNPEKMGPYQDVPFPAALWHEAMGHGNQFIHGGDGTHPLENWNVHGQPRNGRSDGVIMIENEGRRALGIPLRWYQYYATRWRS